MPRNVYFSQGTTAEKRLHEDLVIESLKIYGQDCYYIPRKIVNTNAIFSEDALSQFGDAFMIEAYVDNIDGFGGDGDLLTKFGVEVRDQMTLIISDRRWQDLVGRFQSTDADSLRPKEGDLIFFPMVNGLFEISFIEDENPFYQLQGLPTFRLTCELFEYNNQAIDTGVDEIDVFETEFATRTKLTLGAGSGTYNIGEVVTQGLGDKSPQSVVTAEVAADSDSPSDGSGFLVVYNITTSFDSPERSTTQFGITTGNVGNIIGADSGASYAITATDGFTSIDDNDENAQNVDFETMGNSFIDFSESNPFGEINVTT
tara:strand:- start:771 stop:1715 length:945 start_codon:yes stop_codon:yes gene_type:complete